LKPNFRKVTEFKTTQSFRTYLAAEKINIRLADSIPSDGTATLAQPITAFGKTVGNRWAILPMEGWDCEKDGTPSEYTRRRWLHFASSGAKMIFGTEAAAVMHSGRSNPQQLMAIPQTQDSLKTLVHDMRQTHAEKFGTAKDLLIGLQLTHSGRYSHPNIANKLEPVTAWAHPLLDKKFGCSAKDVVPDEKIPEIIQNYIQAAQVAQNAGFDFVDIKMAHGYLGHEFLTAYDRPGPYGGSFENRTRFFREIATGIQKSCPNLPLSSRVSLFDILPFEKGPDGVGHPMKWESETYPYAFGGAGDGLHMDPDMKETVQFINLLKSFGIHTICATIGSPYYNVHMQRPAYYPVCDGYAMPEHPLYNVSRHLQAVKRIRELCPDLQVICSGLTCLQEYLPQVAEYVLAHNEADFIGIGRMVLSYPSICDDVLHGRPLDRRHICRTFGDCTNAPRNGMISGCYPLDEFYKLLPEAARLRELKRQ